VNKKAAVACSCAAAIASVVVVPMLVSQSINGDEDAVTYLSIAIVSFMSAGVAMKVESMKETPGLQNIALAALMNFIGLGISVYEFLTFKETHKR